MQMKGRGVNIPIVNHVQEKQSRGGRINTGRASMGRGGTFCCWGGPESQDGGFRVGDLGFLPWRKPCLMSAEGKWPAYFTCLQLSREAAQGQALEVRAGSRKHWARAVISCLFLLKGL